MKKHLRSALFVVMLIVSTLAFVSVVKPAAASNVVKRLQGSYVFDGVQASTYTAGGSRVPTSATFTVGTISGDNIDVQIVLKDGNGTAIAYPFETYAWISDSTTGAAYTTTAMSAVLSAVTNGSVESVTSGKSANVISSAAGLLGIRATQSSNTGPTSYLCLRLALGSTSCSGALTYH